VFPAVLLVVVLACTTVGATREAPSYSASSIVNAASNEADSFAPNTFISIYGKGLARSTKALADQDVQGNVLPTVLPNTGVRVLINNIAAHIYYVSPDQINLLIPSDARPGAAKLQLVLDGVGGDPITITLQPAAPALFQWERNAIAIHPDGTLLTPTAPGRPGEWIVLFATGLGSTAPAGEYGKIPTRAAPLRDSAKFRVLLDGAPVQAERVAYAGVAPGFAGLYQINVHLPDVLPLNPEIRIESGDFTSKPAVILPAQP